MAGGNKKGSPKAKKRKAQELVAANKAAQTKKKGRFDRGQSRQG
jgi:hypothetical protein